MVLFWYWSNILLTEEYEDEEAHEDRVAAYSVVLNLFSLYLLILEAPQIWRRKHHYLLSISKCTYLIAPLMIFYNTIYRHTEEASFWTIVSWSSLALWLRFAMYLRIFSQFNWLIRMMIWCLVDMIMFMIVFIIAILAFADTFMSMDRAKQLEGLNDEAEDLAATDMELRFLKGSKGGGGTSAVVGYGTAA